MRRKGTTKKQTRNLENIKMKTVTCEGGNPISKWYSGRDCNEKLRVMEGVVYATCWRCVASKIPGPTLNEKTVSTGFPRGWKFFKEFVHENGKVYHKGIEQPELFGTLTATEIKPIENKPKKKKATLDDKISEEFTKKMRKQKPTVKKETKQQKTIKPTKSTRRKK
jgi:hypothetical protein